MSKREDNIKALLNEFKAEQKKFNEKQEIFNKKVVEQNKKNKRIILIMLIVCLFVSGITSVLSYSMGASSVGYTPRDSNWKVENTQEAIDNLFDSVGSSLVGSIYSYMGVITPPGYLACDGSTYNIEDYPRLANHINVNFGSVNYFGGDGETTFSVPDLRGEFLRGTGTNSHENEGSGANVGIHQGATVMPFYNTGSGDGYARFALSGINAPTDFNSDSYNAISTVRFGINGRTIESNNAYLYRVRPTNTSVLYIIKY